jgi:hypothetical protein
LSELWIYLELGLRHIANLSGYDHILFVAALTIGYAPSEWKRLALLVTAFTIGHSISLAAATLGVVSVPAALVEVLIPATIIATAMQAVIEQHVGVRRAGPSRPRRTTSLLRYLMTVVFGLVHGLGFSSYLRALIGQSEDIVGELFAFNVGLELGQLVILAATLAVSAIAIRVMFTERDWGHFVGGATAGIAVVLLIERAQDALRTI